MISNGQICFGILVEFFPWDKDPWCGEWEEWWRDVNEYVNPIFDPFTDDGNYKPGASSGDFDTFFDYQSDWDKANPFPVDLVRYHDEWILAIPSSTLIESGYPEKFDPASLVVSYEEWQSLMVFCKKWGIATSTPEWWLSSDYA